jgi:motility quorum-sensing regulator/GCU-specific mRNA interferase toxin
LEKLKPSHDLEPFKAAFAQHRAMTLTARLSAGDLGFKIGGVVEIVKSLTSADFIKSMTSYDDHRRWQDVYVVRREALTLYLKFTDRAVTEFIILSFKRK